MARTFTGWSISLFDGLPGGYTVDAFEGLNWTTDCIQATSVPEVSRSRSALKVDCVSSKLNKSIKGSSAWTPVSFSFVHEENNDTQELAVLASNEVEKTISVKIEVEKETNKLERDAFYFTAQVSDLSETDGGNGDTIDTRSLTLLIQSQEVYLHKAFDYSGITDFYQYLFGPLRDES